MAEVNTLMRDEKNEAINQMNELQRSVNMLSIRTQHSELKTITGDS